MENVFLGKEGLTSTSANYLANIAKEQYQAEEEYLSRLTFYSTTVNLLGSKDCSLLREGNTDRDLNSINAKLKRISQLKSFIAWVREAIKARENIVKYLNSFSVTDYCKLMDIKYPEAETIDAPVKGHILTEQEYYDNMPIKERNRYYQLETECAVIGKFIHPNGEFANARKKLLEKISEPHDVTGVGRDAMVYNYNITVDTDKVEDVFFKLQEKHREYQKQLNSIKFECEQAIIDSTTKVNAKYEADTREYMSKRAEAHKKYNDEVLKLNAEYNTYVHDKLQEVKSLKIVIPDSLNAIYNELNTLGKK